MPVYDFSSGLQGLNQGIAALGKGLKATQDWEEGERLAAALFGPNATLGAAPMSLPQSISALGQPRAPQPVQFADSEADVQRLEAGMMPRAPDTPRAPSFAGAPVQAASILKNFEGYRDTPYWDVNAYRIGYGSDTITDPNTGQVRPVQQGDKIDRSYAEADLTRRIPEFQATVAKQTPAFAALPENVKSALTSVAYNYGSLPRSVVAAVETGDPHVIASAVEGLQSHNGGVNKDRRLQEASIIRGGADPADMPAPGAQEAQGFVVPQGGRGGGGISPQQKLIISQMVKNPETRAAGLALWQQSMKAPTTKTVDLGSSIGILDDQGNILREIPKRGAEKWQRLNDGTLFNSATGETRAAEGQDGAAAQGGYGLQPSYGVDAQGNPVILQLGKNGKAIQTALPEGVKLARDPIRVEGPTGTALLDPQTRQQVGYIPKDIAGAKVQEAQGVAQGKAATGLAGATAEANNAISVINQLRNHPGREAGTGFSPMFGALPGTNKKDFNVVLDQAKGKAFLQAFESLKGAGQITEVEGTKATQAIARLDAAQSEGAFLQALDELEGIIRTGLGRSRQQASGAPAAPPPAAPARSDLEAEARRRGLIK